MRSALRLPLEADGLRLGMNQSLAARPAAGGPAAEIIPGGFGGAQARERDRIRQSPLRGSLDDLIGNRTRV